MDSFAGYLSSISPTASLIISIAAMLFCGFLMTRLTKLIRLPNVTAYILTGILLGPYCFKVIPSTIINNLDFLSDIALAFIAFSTGEFFKFSTLRENGMKVVLITLAESLLATVFVFILTYFVLEINLAFSVVLAALAAATAPASTMMTIRQTGAKGDFVNTLLQVVALDDIVGLVAYSAAISVASASISKKAFSVMSIILPLLQNIFVIVLGGLLGWILYLILKNRSKDNKLIITVSYLFLLCGLSALVGISPLLGCMAMGTIYINLSNDSKLFKAMNYFSPPILLLFFVRSGLNFKLDSLFTTSSFGAHPLVLIGVLYFIVRIIGKYLGAFAGCLATGKSHKVRNYLGLALIPQAGVAIGLASIGARTLGGEMGQALETIILASSVLYEMIGPGCAKLSLYLSGSYSTKLEDLTDVAETDRRGKPRSEFEILTERIKKIQEAIPEYSISEENEEAFLEAAEENQRFFGGNIHRMQRHFGRKN